MTPCSTQESKQPPVTMHTISGQTGIFSQQGLSGNLPMGFKGFGGTTSGMMRYPQLILELAQIQASECNPPNVKVLILGPGHLPLEVSDLCSPHTHEIAAAFPPEAEITVVDIAEFVNRIASSVFSPFVRELTESALTFEGGFNMRLMTPENSAKVANFMRKIPDRLTQTIETQNVDFASFKPRKYHYIFAMQSLMYAIQAVYQDRKQALALIAKYLGALEIDGQMFVDTACYDMMSGLIKRIPAPNQVVDGSPVEWNYNATSKFQTRCASVTNDSGNPKSMFRNSPQIFFLKDQKLHYFGTTNVYTITRLS